ncbi:MAG: hypothetical protein QOG30_309 [Acidimicrobiaceae bacterium]|jgi:hypothetical protein
MRPAGATVTHADRYTVLYRRILRRTDGERVAHWGCLRATGRRTRLTEATGKVDDAPISNTKFRTSRRCVAYLRTTSRQGTAVLYIHPFDLRTGRRASGVPASGIPLGESLLRPDGTWSFSVADLAVSDGGGVAWRQVGRPTPDAPTGETIAVHDASGTHVVQLAVPGELRGPSITGDTVSWTTNGARKTYQLT